MESKGLVRMTTAGDEMEHDVAREAYGRLRGREGHLVFASTTEKYSMRGVLVRVTRYTATLVNEMGQDCLVVLPHLVDLRVAAMEPSGASVVAEWERRNPAPAGAEDEELPAPSPRRASK